MGGCGFSGAGTELFLDTSTVATIEDQSPSFSVIWTGDTTIEYTSGRPLVVPGWVLLLAELPQPASSPANPIRMRIGNRFIIRIYRSVIQLGALLALSADTKAGTNALIMPRFWSTENWKILPAASSSTYTAMFVLATAANDGAEQPAPQGNGDWVEVVIPLIVESEPRTSVGSPEVFAMRKTVIFCDPWLTMNRKRESFEVAPA